MGSTMVLAKDTQLQTWLSLSVVKHGMTDDVFPSSMEVDFFFKQWASPCRVLQFQE